ncbi:MAG: N-acetylmuramoyl-L-alanine amidase [Paludibacteraceae bacterium]|nr:N-acetylmuramoyl-L-alanine amidase [Paludibacteraceae bacterium]
MNKLTIILFFAWVFSAPALAFTVVIDAGHGGKDAGAVGKKYYEKNLNLDVTLLVGKKIQQEYPDVKVVYTRTTDVFLPLQKRADIVNKNNADLFICIHTNSSENRSVTGAETFILGTEKMGQNLDVAMRENAVIKLESDYQTTYQGFDPNSIDSYIMFELMQNQYMDQSLRFASLVQHQFSGVLQRADRGVRQAAFWVLLKSACPSVLVEMGFISHPEEELYLGSAAGKEQMAEAIMSAFRAFIGKQSERPEPTLQTTSEPAVSSDSTTTKTVVDTIAKKVDETVVKRGPQYGVQIFVSSKLLSGSDANFHGEKEYKYFVKNGLYKYYIGPFDTRDEAAERQKVLRQHFPDCFIIKLEQE